MAQVQIKNLSIRHEAILEYLIANPAAKLGDVAKEFQIGQAQLSIIIHSDAFQRRLKKRSDEFFASAIVPLRERVVGVANLCVEKLGEVMENASPKTDKQFIADTADAVLKNLGYSAKTSSPPPAAGPTQNNYFVVDAKDLETARKIMRSAPEDTSRLLEGEVESEETVPPEGV